MINTHCFDIYKMQCFEQFKKWIFRILINMSTLCKSYVSHDVNLTNKTSSSALFNSFLRRSLSCKLNDIVDWRYCYINKPVGWKWKESKLLLRINNGYFAERKSCQIYCSGCALPWLFKINMYARVDKRSYSR